MMNMMGVLNFTAPYLPWVMLGFQMLLGGSPWTHVLGMSVGHVIWFAEDVLPRMLPDAPRIFLAPDVMRVALGQDPRGMAPLPPFRVVPGARILRRGD